MPWQGVVVGAGPGVAAAPAPAAAAAGPWGAQLQRHSRRVPRQDARLRRCTQPASHSGTSHLSAAPPAED